MILASRQKKGFHNSLRRLLWPRKSYVRSFRYFIKRVLRAAVKKGARNPRTLANLVNTGVENIRLDQGTTAGDLIALGRAFRSFDPNATLFAQGRDRYDELASWSAEHFPGAQVRYAWSAQDYQEASGLPSVGRLPLTGGHVLAATGFDKWGLTNGAAAALRLTYLITGNQPAPGMADWADRLDRIHLGGPGAVDLVRFSGMVAVEAALGWTSAERQPIGDVAEGHGETGRLGVRPAARSTVDGVTCTVSAVCTHLGGIVGWNEAEQTWDCPLHGSRFAPDGALIEGPAVDGLERLD